MLICADGLRVFLAPRFVSKCLEDLLVRGQEGGFTMPQRMVEVASFLALTVSISMFVKKLDLVLGRSEDLICVLSHLSIVGILVPEFILVICFALHCFCQIHFRCHGLDHSGAFHVHRPGASAD